MELDVQVEPSVHQLGLAPFGRFLSRGAGGKDECRCEAATADWIGRLYCHTVAAAAAATTVDGSRRRTLKSVSRMSSGALWQQRSVTNPMARMRSEMYLSQRGEEDGPGRALGDDVANTVRVDRP